jgi:hypothetical protein
MDLLTYLILNDKTTFSISSILRPCRTHGTIFYKKNSRANIIATSHFNVISQRDTDNSNSS